MTNKDLCRIGSRLKKAREAKHLTREQLAEMVDLTDNYIGMLERGERMPKLATFMDIIEALEVTADAILCDVVSYGYKVQLGEQAEKIDKLPKKNREKLIKIIADFLE